MLSEAQPPVDIREPEAGMGSATEVNEATTQWIESLPLRWAFGGFVLGLVWSALSSALQGSFLNPVGGPVAAIVRIVLMIVIPLCILGFAWGLSERIDLNRWSAQGRLRLDRALKRHVLRQVGKAIVCGALFGLFTFEMGLYRSFRPWDSEENIT